MATAGDVFRIDISRDGLVACLQLHGDLDAATAPVLEAGLAAAAGSGAEEIVVDCSDLDFIDSSGLSVLVSNHKRLQKAGQALVVAAAPPGALRLFEISGIDRVLHLRDRH